MPLESNGNTIDSDIDIITKVTIVHHGTMVLGTMVLGRYLVLGHRGSQN